MTEHKVKTDCFAYRPKGLNGRGKIAKCNALNRLYCREEKCGFYKAENKKNANDVC